MKSSRFCIKLFSLLLLTGAGEPSLRAQNYQPPFPRLVFQRPGGIGGGSVQYFFSRYDLAIHGGGRQNAYALNDSIHAINPNTVILGTNDQGVWPGSYPPGCFLYRAQMPLLTRPVHPGDTEIYVTSTDGFPTSAETYRFALLDGEEWINYQDLTDTSFVGVSTTGDFILHRDYEVGDSVKTPIRFIGFGMLQNLTPFAPLVDGKPVWQYFIDKRFNPLDQDFSRFDGVFYDAFRFFFWGNDINGGVDCDYDHIDDLTEHGLDWFNQQWEVVVKQMLPYERQKFAALNPGKPVIIAINMGTALEGDPYPLHYCDGMMWEGFMRFAYSCPELIRINQIWEAAHDSVFTIVEDYVTKLNHIEDYKKIRYGLTAAMVSGAYYGMTFGNEYSISLYYDEFDLDVGYPTGPGMKIPGLGDVYVRYFDRGAAICNASGRKATVTDAMLSGMTGCQGPYYRFLGGQKPSVNNGQLFSSIELYGETPNPARPKENIGDGIILLNHPDTVIADIIVGTWKPNDTSPGTSKMHVQGRFSPVWDKAIDESDFASRNRCYSQWAAGKPDSTGLGYYYSDKSFGFGSVTFRPTIGVSGYYEISEWHPFVGNAPSAYREAADVPFEVVITDQRRLAGIIDQTKKYGCWNRIATFYLPTGTSSYVRITNQCNGYVAADAMRFRYLKSPKPDTTPPMRPKGARFTR